MIPVSGGVLAVCMLCISLQGKTEPWFGEETTHLCRCAGEFPFFTTQIHMTIWEAMQTVNQTQPWEDCIAIFFFSSYADLPRHPYLMQETGRPPNLGTFSFPLSLFSSARKRYLYRTNLLRSAGRLGYGVA